MSQHPSTRARTLVAVLRRPALAALAVTARCLTPTDPDTEEGQATAEYALVLLGAAALALLVVGWATKTNLVGRLLDAVFGQLLGRAAGK